jgi:hypothetical protein
MRKALNDNPIAQIAIVGVLLAASAMFVMGGMGKKSSDEPAATVSDPGAAQAAPAPDPAATGTTTAPATAPAPVTPTAGTPSSMGPPLPPAVDAAYRDDQTIVLLVTRGGGYDDRLMRRSVGRLRSLPGIAVFTTRASGIARYARITQAVNIDRVPALILVTPRDLSQGSAPAAESLYGFHSTQSVVQAVRDILYRGPTVGYSPD